jgi:pilus assembly protein CpaD
VLAACSYPDSTTTLAETDYRARYPIGVKTEVVAAVFHGDDSQGLSVAERAMLQQFITAYVERGQRPLTIVLGGAGMSRRTLAADLQETAIDYGLARSEVLVGVDPAQSEDIVTASFVSHTAIVPECGYWSQESHNTLSNANSLNFGCASQHNLGLMLADPSDLITPSPFDPRDGLRTAIVIDLYRRGEITGAEWNEADTSIVDVGE